MKNTAESTPSWIGAVWSYVNYHIKNKEYGVAETYNYIYYTVKDEPTQLNGKIYYPLIRYVEDDEVGEVLFHIRQEGDVIYRYMSSLKCDTLFYDFSLKTDDICKIAGVYDTDRFKIGKISSVQTKAGTIFRVFEILACYENNEWGPIDEWIQGIGSENGLFYQYDINGSIIGNYGSTLNYYRSGNGEVVYKNPHSFGELGTTDYKWDDRYANEAKPYYSLLVDGTEWILRLENKLTKKETYLTQRLDGDSLLNDTLFKKLYSREYHTNGSLIADTIHLLYQEKNLLLNRNKVIFNFGMHGLPEYLNQQGCIMYAIQTSDTVLTDGVSHRSLSIVKKGENGIFDTWIEGIGSLQYGITQSFPILSPTTHSELLSCSLNGKYLYNKKGTVSPVDKTHLLINPDYANNDNTGWSGTTPAFQTYQNAEHYNKKFNTYQDLENLPNGVYAVGLQGFYRANTYESPLCAKLYAKSGEDSLSTSLPSIHAGAVETPYGFNSVDEIQAGNKDLYIPNTLKAAATYLQHEAYCTTLFFAVEGGNARIGLAKDTLIWQDWTAWQDWNLTYYGNDEAAYQSWLDFAKSKAPRFDDVVLTAGLFDAYNALLSDNSVSNKAEVLSAIHALEEKAAELNANSEAWMAYDKAVKDLQSILEDSLPGFEEALNLCKEYYEQTALGVIQSRLLTTEEVIAETQKVQDLLDQFITISSIDVNQSESASTKIELDGEILRCTSPTATLLEVYTSTGIKVGEAAFQNGEAVVKVGSNVPSLYLYVVTYPDGTRSSGKMMRK